MSKSVPYRPLPPVSPKLIDMARKLCGSGDTLQAIHVYRDWQGFPIFAQARILDRDGKKTIRPIRENADGSVAVLLPEFVKGMRPLYNLHLLSRLPSAPVFLVEGEKCADYLTVLGYLATTWLGGASGVDHCDLSPLYGRVVFQWADNDDPGRNSMAKAQAHLLANGASSYLIDIDMLDLPEKGDVVDWGEHV